MHSTEYHRDYFYDGIKETHLRFKIFQNFTNPEKRAVFPKVKNVESFDKIRTINGEKYPVVILVSMASSPSTKLKKNPKYHVKMLISLISH